MALQKTVILGSAARRVSKPALTKAGGRIEHDTYSYRPRPLARRSSRAVGLPSGAK